MTAAEVLRSSELPREVAGDLNRFILKTPASSLEEVLTMLDSMARDIETRIGSVECGGYGFIEVWPPLLRTMGDALRYEADRLAVSEAPQAGA